MNTIAYPTTTFTPPPSRGFPQTTSPQEGRKYTNPSTQTPQVQFGNLIYGGYALVVSGIIWASFHQIKLSLKAHREGQQQALEDSKKTLYDQAEQSMKPQYELAESKFQFLLNHLGESIKEDKDIAKKLVATTLIADSDFALVQRVELLLKVVNLKLEKEADFSFFEMLDILRNLVEESNKDLLLDSFKEDSNVQKEVENLLIQASLYLDNRNYGDELEGAKRRLNKVMEELPRG